MTYDETLAAAMRSAEIDAALADFREYRDRIASTFPLDDSGKDEEQRLLDAFDAAFTLGYVRATLRTRAAELAAAVDDDASRK